ncbi:YlbL family protein [Natranaerobius thermophilus]|uniref:PDZ/DHR/GLGF domain protein n=1 Tax=Natranaerobius thermophilus (strain ATCC BAA-1301 / DSM 18059 / JW/NM-WN-LF) TaxID=457570 RepID=B2A2M0_NATTJ|nr:PDZ domain-containing protein [Natranaerobius thermophilus]ACB84935.1 PDZ/DHR/GLGF domain protein [Natranaerobius thermophilus JW/NM-WN-LF]
MTNSKSLIARILQTFAVVAVLILLLSQVTPDYYLVQPGTPLELSEVIEIDNDSQKFGNLFLTTVNQSRTSGVSFLYGLLNPNAELHEIEEVIPPEMDVEEYREMMQQRMTDSQNIAKTVALENLGHEIEFTGEGIKVLELAEDSPAENILKKDDIITKVNGEPIYLAEELVGYIENHPIGETVELTIERNNQEELKTVETKAHPDNPDNSYLGVFIKTVKWEPILPVDINFETGGIGGPSAGLMFVLEIMNQLTEEDLSQGRVIAGTGAIDLDGSVNAVGGVRHKVRAAEAQGATYFLVPENNYEEAQQGAEDIKVVKVTNIEEVQDFLESL